MGLAGTDRGVDWTAGGATAGSGRSNLAVIVCDSSSTGRAMSRCISAMPIRTACAATTRMPPYDDLRAYARPVRTTISLWGKLHCVFLMSDTARVWPPTVPLVIPFADDSAIRNSRVDTTFQFKLPMKIRAPLHTNVERRQYKGSDAARCLCLVSHSQTNLEFPGLAR